MNKIISFLVVLFVLVAGITYWIHNNLDRVVRDAIVEYGSEMTQAHVSLDSVKIDLRNGKCLLKNLKVGNPAGFKTAYALKVDAFEIEIDPASITKDVVTIKHINIKTPDIIYEKQGELTNFDALEKNTSTYIAKKMSSDGASKDNNQKKFIVEHFDLTNANVSASAGFMHGKTVSLGLPDIHVANLGKSRGGLSAGDLGKALIVEIKQQLLDAVSFSKLAKSFADGISDAAKSVGDAAGEAVSKIKSLF